MGNGISSGVLGTSSVTPASGNPSFNAILSTRQWSVGSDRVITFSFPSSTSRFRTNYGSRDEMTNWTPFSETMKEVARSALANWSRYADISLVEVADDQSGAGDIRFAWTAPQGADFDGHAYLPSTLAEGGDVWMNGTNIGGDFGIGSALYGILLFNIGIALGLTNGVRATEDISDLTLMAPYGNESIITPLYWDVQAIQYLYGVNTTAAGGNNTYVFGRWNATIWDTGGIDTLSFAPAQASFIININADKISSLSVSGGYQVRLMPGVVIENAIGSRYGDTITGNDVANILDGEGENSTLSGDDKIYGAAGNDTIRGLGGNDLVYGDADDDDVNGNQGQDTVYGGDGADFVRGGQGNDIVYGDLGNDPHVNGNIGNDTVYGGIGNDAVFGGQNEDHLYGDAGNDTLSGDLGNDTLTGGDGADQFRFQAGGGSDQITSFSFGDGDRIALPTGTAYTTAAGSAGELVLNFSGGSVTVSGFVFGAFTLSMIVFT